MAPACAAAGSSSPMSRRLQQVSAAPSFEATIAQPAGRTETLADALGVGSGRMSLKLRAYETQHEVLERYYGSAVDVAVALVRDTTDSRRERLEVVCAPDVQLEQNVEELLFRAYSLYRQVHLTFVSRARPGAVPAHDLRRHRRAVRRARPRRRARGRRARRVRADQLPRDRVRPRRGLLQARRPAPRAAALPGRHGRRADGDGRDRRPALARPRDAPRHLRPGAAVRGHADRGRHRRRA